MIDGNTDALILGEKLALCLAMELAPVLGALGFHALAGARLRRVRQCALTPLWLRLFCRCLRTR